LFKVEVTVNKTEVPWSATLVVTILMVRVELVNEIQVFVVGLIVNVYVY